MTTANIYQGITPKQTLTFKQILANEEYKDMVEMIEWGSSDVALEIEDRQTLYAATGWKWQD